MTDETNKVAQHQRVPEDLPASEIRYRRLFESARDGILILDADSRKITDVNPFMMELLGYSRDEFLGKELWEIGLFKDKHESQTAFGELQAAGYIRYEDLPLQTKAGKLWNVEFISNVYQEDGHHVIQCNIRDITERKAAEILLDTQRQAFEMVVGGSPLAEVLEYLARIVERQSAGSSIVSILLLDKQGRLHNGASPSLPEDYVQAIEGIKADKQVGTCSAAAATGKTIISPDIAADPMWQDLKHLPLGLGLQAAWSLPIVAADKGVLGTFGTYFREKREPTQLERQTVEILAKTAALAIERKQVEEALHDAHGRITNIFESITDCFYALDADWRFTYVNPQAEAYFNRPKEAMLGRRYVEVFPLTRDSEVLARLQEAMSEQKPLQFEIISPTTGKWVELHVFPADGGLGVYFRDITERRGTEEALRESETRFRAMFEQANVGIVQASFDGTLLKVNPGFCKIVGYSEEEASGMAIRDLTHPDDYEEEEALTRQLMTGEIPGYSIEKRYLRKDGHLVWGQMTATLVSQSSGEPFYVLAIIEDITERKRAEEALRESEERLRAMFEASRDGILVENDERIVYVNTSYTHMFGYDAPEELIGQHVSTVISPEDIERLLKLGSRRGRGESVVSFYEFKGKRKDGTFVDVEASVSTSTVAGRAYITTMIRDITERKQAEEALRQAHDQLERRVAERTAELAQINESLQAEIYERTRTEEKLRENEQRLRIAVQTGKLGSWELDLATGTLSCSDICKAHFGLPPEAEFSYDTLFAAVHPDDHARVAGAVEQALEKHTDYEAEYRNLWPDGSAHWIITRGRGIYAPDGEPTLMVGVTLDITERKQAEEARRELLRQLVTAQEDERRRISRELHDQMGQHLVAIVLLVNSLKDSSPSESATATRFAQLEDVAHQLSLQVDTLAWKLRPTELDDVGLHAALGNYIGKWSKRYGLRVDLHSVSLVDQRLDSEIETAIYRIVQEALTNIIKHARATYVSLILERRGNHAFAIIEDNGCGFDVEGRLAARARERRMGLLGMEERTALVGGTLHIESTLGAGTTIFVRIPLALDKNGGQSF